MVILIIDNFSNMFAIVRAQPEFCFFSYSLMAVVALQALCDER